MYILSKLIYSIQPTSLIKRHLLYTLSFELLQLVVGVFALDIARDCCDSNALIGTIKVTVESSIYLSVEGSGGVLMLMHVETR